MMSEQKNSDIILYECLSVYLNFTAMASLTLMT